MVLSNDRLGKSCPTFICEHPVLSARDAKNKTPLYYAATTLARYYKQRCTSPSSASSSVLSPPNLPPSNDHDSSSHMTSSNSAITTTSSLKVTQPKGDKEVLVSMIYEMLMSGLISPQSELREDHHSNATTTSSTTAKSSNNSSSTAYDVLLNQTDFFNTYPQFKDWFLSKQQPLVSSPSKYRQRFNSDDQASATTRLSRSASGTVFKKLTLFQSSSLAEDVDLRPISPMKRMQTHK